MATSTTKTNKPIIPRGQDASPLKYNRAALYSGKALDFDGVNDLVTMPTALTSSLSTTSVTFVTNVKTDFATWAGTRDDAFSFSERGVILAFNNGSIYYYYRHQSSGWRNLQVPNADFKPQEWNQMVTTIDLNTNTWKAYVNGVEVATSGTYSDTAIAYDANALTIGAQAGARFFDGQIAGFKIFNTALTAAQVSDLYNNPEKIVPTGVSNDALKLWLPMMEGAGTTAYDGSGNGNHGTISGATYVNGVGAPVAQSAVMDWNKGSNLISYSEELENASWFKGGTTANDGENDSLGTTRATELREDNTSGQHVAVSNDISITSGTQYYISVLAKQGSGSRYLGFAGMGLAGASESPVFDLQNGSVDLGASSTIAKSANIEPYGSEGWYKCSMVLQANSTASLGFYFTLVSTATDNTVNGYNYSGDGTSSIFLFAPMLKVGSEAGPYTPTLSTAQTSPVLLPQGLTSGRDITGVNLFENVRKQGALNLDGNSWAEVHDNASLDVSPSMTMEAWVYAGEKLSGVYDHIFVKQDATTWASPYGRYVLRMRQDRVQWWFDSSSNTANYNVTLTGWNHLVATKDGTSEKLYVNGSEVATNTGAATITASAYSLLIGSRTGHSVAEIFPHPIAQPRIYNRALTAEEVLRNYNSEKNTYQ